MAAMFYLASLCLYIKSRVLQSNRSISGIGRFYYILSLMVAIIAMFTKENTMTLPLMILLYEIFFLNTKRNLNWGYLAPFLDYHLIIPLTMFLTKSVQFQEIKGVALWTCRHFSHALLPDPIQGDGHLYKIAFPAL